MTQSEAKLLSRRNVVAFAAALALPWGCAVTLPSLREVNLDGIAPDQALLLGRIRLTILDFDRTGDAFVCTNAGAGEVLLPPDGEVAWVVRRPTGMDVRLLQISSSGKTLTLFKGAVLAPHAARTAINYFGTINVTFDRGLDDPRESERTSQIKVDVVDDHRASMLAFVAQNPRLAGRIYYHVLRDAILEAPSLPG